MKGKRDIIDTARRVPCSDWTVRRYLYRGVIQGEKDGFGKIWLAQGAVHAIRRHMQAFGGPGGRPMPRPW